MRFLIRVQGAHAPKNTEGVGKVKLYFVGQKAQQGVKRQPGVQGVLQGNEMVGGEGAVARPPICLFFPGLGHMPEPWTFSGAGPKEYAAWSTGSPLDNAP